MSADSIDLAALRGMKCGPPASEEEIRRASETLGFPLAEDHRRLLLEFDGLEGYLNPENFLALWGCRELIELNEAYRIQDFASDILLIGSNGCGEALAYDHGAQGVPLVHIPFVGLNRTRIEYRAGSLSEYFLRIGPLKPSKPVRHEENELVETQPILLGGHPTDPKNKQFLNRQQHIQFANFWNRVIREAEQSMHEIGSSS